jgi:hypothetical protein
LVEKKLDNSFLRQAQKLPNFYSKLITEKLLHGDSVLTFNYDLLIDAALQDVLKLSHVDFGIDYYEYLPWRLRDDPRQKALEYMSRGCDVHGNGGFTVLKMHGSLNWCYCVSCKSVTRTGNISFSKGVKLLKKCVGNKHLNENFGYTICCPNFDPRLLIVPPSWLKKYNNKHLDNIWDVALLKLYSADEIYFLGYSFSDSDYQLRYLLNRAKAMKKGLNWKNVHVVDVNTNAVRDRYLSFFGRSTFVQGKASEFVETLNQR